MVDNVRSQSPLSSADSQFARASTLSHHATIRTVVTSPPSKSAWAKDEPPSPTGTIHGHAPSSSTVAGTSSSPDFRQADASSVQSSALQQEDEPSRWWSFARNINRPSASPFPLGSTYRQHTSRPEKKLTISSWRSSSQTARQEQQPPPQSPVDMEQDDALREKENRLQIALPPPPAAPNTIAQSRTPGWDVPWTPRADGMGDYLSHGQYEPLDPDHSAVREAGLRESLTKAKPGWAGMRQRARRYLLSNVYVPLIFRMSNLSLTSAALAVAIRIRHEEEKRGVMGIMGSSPTLVVIFAPVTLLHVLVSIYLEYFGRPLGLWRTSAKLANTLTEVLAICAWAAALSLCFDNFFTSSIPCAHASSVSWYSSIGRAISPVGDLGDVEGTFGEALCDEQLALICLVGVGLIMYCFNLVISLFRIFEKVKYHHAPELWPSTSGHRFTHHARP